jgi:hypothetical protein
VISAWGFYGNITLSTAVSTPGLRAFLNTTHVSVTPFTFAHVLLTVDTAGVQFGDYNVTITATSSPSRSHQLVYHVSAWPESTAASPGPVIYPQLLVWAGLLIFVVAIALSDILLRRRRRKELRETENSTTENRSE